jgi:hypothetical protein
MNSKAGTAVAMLVLIAALAPLALLMWRMSDAEWDAPREIAGARRGAGDAAAPEAPATAEPAPAV